MGLDVICVCELSEKIRVVIEWSKIMGGEGLEGWKDACNWMNGGFG